MFPQTDQSFFYPGYLQTTKLQLTVCVKEDFSPPLHARVCVKVVSKQNLGLFIELCEKGVGTWVMRQAGRFLI